MSSWCRPMRRADLPACLWLVREVGEEQAELQTCDARIQRLPGVVFFPKTT